VASWEDVRAEAPELAEAVQARFAAHRHAVLGTLRRDGGPRLSGTETTFKDGELWLGSMDPARKVDDLRRDPRLALHSATADPELVGGDAKIIAGPRRSSTRPPGPPWSRARPERSCSSAST